MNKDKMVIAVTISTICIILTFVLTVQLRTVKETDITLIESMREDELKEQIEIWKTRYEETQAEIDEDDKKINEYKEKSENNQEASELLNSELKKMRTILGTTDVEGEGVIITLKGRTEDVVSEDLIKLVNELKLAGAEAISINDERIINFSEIVDVSSYVIINGKRLTSPFTIKAIGNMKYLTSGINSKGGFADSEKVNGKEITISEERNVKILKYSGDINLKTIK